MADKIKSPLSALARRGDHVARWKLEIHLSQKTERDEDPEKSPINEKRAKAFKLVVDFYVKGVSNPHIAAWLAFVYLRSWGVIRIQIQPLILLLLFV